MGACRVEEAQAGFRNWYLKMGLTRGVLSVSEFSKGNLLFKYTVGKFAFRRNANNIWTHFVVSSSSFAYLSA